MRSISERLTRQQKEFDEKLQQMRETLEVYKTAPNSFSSSVDIDSPAAGAVGPSLDGLAQQLVTESARLNQAGTHQAGFSSDGRLGIVDVSRCVQFHEGLTCADILGAFQDLPVLSFRPRYELRFVPFVPKSVVV